MKNTPDQIAVESAPEKANNNSAAAQRQRLLEELKRRAVSTIQARRDLDIMMPATRIFELRHNEDYNIKTVWVTEETEAGKPHRVALYVLQTTQAGG